MSIRTCLSVSVIEYVRKICRKVFLRSKENKLTRKNRLSINLLLKKDRMEMKANKSTIIFCFAIWHQFHRQQFVEIEYIPWRVRFYGDTKTLLFSTQVRSENLFTYEKV